MNNLEILEIIKKNWATSEDIQKLSDCGINKSQEIRRNIEQQIVEEGKKLPPISNQVPMQDVVKYLGLNESRIIKFAKVEKELEIKKPLTFMSDK